MIFFYEKTLLLFQWLPLLLELSLTLLPLNHRTCSSVCVSGHFSSCTTLLGTCMSAPEGGIKVWTSLPQCQRRISVSSPRAVFWQYPRCWPSPLLPQPALWQVQWVGVQCGVTGHHPDLPWSLTPSEPLYPWACPGPASLKWQLSSPYLCPIR